MTTPIISTEVVQVIAGNIIGVLVLFWMLVLGKRPMTRPQRRFLTVAGGLVVFLMTEMTVIAVLNMLNLGAYTP